MDEIFLFLLPQAKANKKLLAAVTGAIWKCAKSQENVLKFNQYDLIHKLIGFLDESEDEDVLTNVIGAIAECCKFSPNRDTLLQAGGLPKLVRANYL